MEGLIGLGSIGFLLAWLVCPVIGGMAGQRKGAGAVGAILGLILGPMGIALAIAMIGSRTECLFCRELVRFHAKKCPHCQSELPAAPGVQFLTKEGKVT